MKASSKDLRKKKYQAYKKYGNQSGGQYQKVYSCDFETNNHKEDCRVWAVAIYEIYSKEFTFLKTITDFFSFFGTHAGKYYFHNLKFDGGFIIDWLLKNNYKHTLEKDPLPNEFSTLISDMNVFYQIKINMGGRCNTIQDSYKVLPFPVKKIPEVFGLEESKGELDYNKVREPGHELTEEEKEYITHDVSIVGESLRRLFDQGLTHMTQGSNAFHHYKTMKGKDFRKLFPALDEKTDSLMRPSYKGGFTYAMPSRILQDIGEGIVLDKNSMYPWIMRELSLPFGEPVEFKGMPKKDKAFPLYIFQFLASFDLKAGYLPTVQDKSGHYSFKPTEYITSTEGKQILLTMTNIDWELFKEHYTIYPGDFVPIGGWRFQASSNLFKDYIDEWYKVKEQASIEGNEALRTMAKFMLNTLYGKFGFRLKGASKYPILENNKVRYKLGEEEIREGIYLPVAIFVTAWARNDIIRAGQANIDRLLYIDTDSLHLLGNANPRELFIDDYKLGAWKIESKFCRARYIRAKRYIEDTWNKKEGCYKLMIKCAGLPAVCHSQVTWDNFRPGMIYTGKLQHMTVEGGVYLKETTFELCS